MKPSAGAQRPNVGDLQITADWLGIRLSDLEERVYSSLIGELQSSFERLDELTSAPSRPVNRRYWRPEPNDNRLGAWYIMTSIPTASKGALVGLRVGIKDNICVAGVPMAIGSDFLEGYIPDVDATVVERLLQAGGFIAGKTVCEYLCGSGASSTSHTGPVRNPHEPQRSAGGSSSGSAALIGAGDLDAALGADQGGSIRIPSSWCGVYGLKPTFGLVPYTGVVSGEFTLDHVGPMGATPRHVAMLLDAIAGPDGLDPRQQQPAHSVGYVRALKKGVKGLRIGILNEGFNRPALSESVVDDAVHEAAESFHSLGCSVREVSIPWHLDGQHVSSAIDLLGSPTTWTNGMGFGWKGKYVDSLMAYYSKGLRSGIAQLPPTIRFQLLAGHYLSRGEAIAYYGRAQNLVGSLGAAYDAEFEHIDLLILPTVPIRAPYLLSPTASLDDAAQPSKMINANTSPFNATGHPAMNVPCAVTEGLPVGMMIVGRLGDDALVLRAADAFARHCFFPPTRHRFATPAKVNE